MADRHTSYPMMPNFNPSLLQQQQMQQHSQGQQGPPSQGAHQGMQQPFPGQNTAQQPLWMQSMAQFRQPNGGQMDSAEMNQQMNDFLQSNIIARQQQQQFGLGQPGPSAGAAPSGFHDGGAAQRGMLPGGFAGGMPAAGTLSSTSMQARNAMMQAFNQNHNRQLNLIDMAGNQQTQHRPPGLFAPTSDAQMRQPSPARPPQQQQQQQTQPQSQLMPNGQPRTVPLELQTKIMQIRSHISQTETSLRQLHSSRTNMSDAVFMQQAKAYQGDLVKGKEMLNRLIQYATHQQQQQQQQQAHQQQQPQQPPHQPPQPAWMQPPGQAPAFGPQATPQLPTNAQPSPGQRHPQPPQNIPMPNRSIPTPHQQPPQNGQYNKPPGAPISQLPPPLEKDRFDKAFDNFIKRGALPRDPRTIALEGRLLDFHALHSAVFSEGGYSSVTQRDLWAVIAARIGFIQFPGNDVEPAKSGPAIAHQIDQIYKEFVAQFDSAYMSTVMESRRKFQASMAAAAAANGGHPPGGGVGGGGIPGMPNPGARVANPQQMQLIMSYADQSVDQLRANGVAENIISFIEQHRPNIQRNMLDQQAFRQLVVNHPGNPQQMNGGMPARPFSAQNGNPMHPNAPNQPQFSLGPSVAETSTHEHKQQIQKALMQQFVRNNQNDLTRVTNLLNTMKEEFLRNRMHHLPAVAVPPEQRMEYNSVVEQLHRSASELDAKLPMLFLFLKNEPWIRKVAIIVVTVQQQRNFLSSSNPRFIVSLDNLRHMLQEVHKAHEGFNNTMQGIAAQGMANFNNNRMAQMNQQPNPNNPNMQQMQTPQPHPSLPPQQQPMQPPQNRLPPPPPAAAPTPPARNKRGSMQPGAAASPTPPPPSATTPVANAPTPAASSPKSPKTKGKKAPAKRRPSKVQSTPTVEAASLPAPSPGTGNKRQREEDASPPTASGSTPPFMGPVASEPSPPKRLKTEWEGSSNEALKQREEQAVKVETEEDASVFLEQMTELIKMAAGGEGQESLSSDISDTLDLILKGYGSVPDGGSSLSMLGEGSSSGGGRAASPPIPSVDEFVEFFDFSSFETGGGGGEEDAPPPDNEATPDLVSSSSTNPSPESGSGSEADGHTHTAAPALTFSDMKGEDVGDPLRLSTMKEVDGGEAAFYQFTDWKWDGPMSTSDQPWAIS